MSLLEQILAKGEEAPKAEPKAEVPKSSEPEVLVKNYKGFDIVKKGETLHLFNRKQNSFERGKHLGMDSAKKAADDLFLQDYAGERMRQTASVKYPMLSKVLAGKKAEAGIPEKYKHIDFKPSEQLAKNAKRGLQLRQELGRGGTEVGVARARDLQNRKTLSPDTARRMKAYFDRHQSDDLEYKGKDTTAGYVAWLLWGGDAGWSWAKKIVRQMEAADKQAA